MAEHEKEGQENAGHAGHGGGHSHAGHGGGAHEEHEGAPEWLISFADNTALMMGLFVIMLAMNMGPKARGLNKADGGEETPASTSDRALDWVIGVRSAFNNPVSLDSKDPKDAPLIRRMHERVFGPIDEEAPSGNSEQLQSARPSEYSDINATVTFDDGSELLTAGAKETLADIALRIKGLAWIVEVRGHVSPTERLRTGDRGLDLAFARARSAAYQLATQGVPWERMRLVACGDADRVVARTYNPAEDRPNQRAEVLLTRELMPADPYSREVTRPAPPSKPAETAPADDPSLSGGG